MNIVRHLFVVIFNVILLTYVVTLENKKCECSQSWKRDYIKYYTGTVASIFTLIILGLVLGIRLPNNKPLSIIFMLTLFVATLVQVYALFTYSQDLNCRRESCPCTEGWKRDFMYFYGIFFFAIYVLAISSGLLCLLSPKCRNKVTSSRSGSGRSGSGRSPSGRFVSSSKK
jgi:hypothetical protein